ncbi:hypothetical protein B296_00003297 [Ensete ventricosum]|uniref:Trehalose-phosphatase n=1 Tax=Ensete ventricosum TaxID=4639 RepID=A0A427ATH1_ENSVE|nr:hypothetical protein B296_00003297 [Ensete ventricosum]
MNHPSALTAFHQITAYAKYKKIVLFLDYDGTLSPIVDNPDHAFMSSAMRAAVKEVAKYFPTAIISGRSRSKVFDSLNDMTKDIVGAIVENNKFCVSVHYRNVDEKV